MANFKVTIEFHQPDGDSVTYIKTFSAEQFASSVYMDIAKSENDISTFARQSLEDFRAVVIADASRLTPFHQLPAYNAFASGESDSLR